MVIMNILRMMVDVSFFFTFASFVAASFGGSGAFIGALVQCLCFGLSYLGGKKRILRLLFLSPIVLCLFLYRASSADCIMLIPSAIYIFWLVFRDDYVLDHARQIRLFSLFLKIILPFVCLVLLSDGFVILTQMVLPFSATMLIGSVFLLRSLRHNPKIYCQKKYQLVNALVLVLVALGGLFLGSKTFLTACAVMLKAFYTTLILPILYLIFAGLAWILTYVIRLFSFVEWKSPKYKQDINLENLDPSDLLSNIGAPSNLAEALKKLIIAGGVLLICLLVFLFFRWLNGKNTRTSHNEPVRMVSRTTLSNRQTASVPQDSSVTHSIRALYRKFLKFCVGHGIQFDHSATSLDVDERASRLPGFGTASSQIRSIYIRARYAGIGEKSDLKKLKQLFAEAKSNNKNV